LLLIAGSWPHTLKLTRYQQAQPIDCSQTADTPVPPAAITGQPPPLHGQLLIDAFEGQQIAEYLTPPAYHCVSHFSQLVSISDFLSPLV